LRIVKLHRGYGNSGEVLKVPLLATLLTDSRKYAAYDNTTSFSQFQAKNILFQAHSLCTFGTKYGMQNILKTP
jgi:hypothetical protein